MSLLNNRYEIVRPIKSGGFGEVYLAKDHNLGIDVALKRYHLEKMASKVGGHKMAQKYSVISEIRRAILFNHPNVARYFDAFSYEQDSTFGVEHYEIGVMEYLSEGDLGEFVQRNGIGSQKVKNALIGVLEGLEYLHSKQIIHRDIKENNILFDGEVPKIIDFGISKNADSNASGSTSLLFSTPGYLAPEQIEPTKYSVNGNVIHNIDFWAFGIMLYALIKKELPFGTNTDTEESKSAFRLRVLSQSIDEINWTGIPEPYAKVIKMCLVKDANHRVKSAKELIQAILGLQGGTRTDEGTILDEPPPKPRKQPKSTSKPPDTSKPNYLPYIIGVLGIILGVIGLRQCSGGGTSSEAPLEEISDTTLVNQDAGITEAPPTNSETKKEQYASYIKEGDTKLRSKDYDGAMVAYIYAKSAGYDNGAAEAKINKAKSMKKEAEREASTKVVVEEKPKPDPSPAPSGKPYIKMISIPGRSYKLSETEVTIGQYLAFCRATDSHWPVWLEAGSNYNIHTGTENHYSSKGMSESNVNHPITGVSALDADAFCRWMGGRLPTEDEWDYAAKGGESYEYAGSDNIEAVAWYNGNSGDKAHRVGGKSPNGYGLYDMSGNVWEWTSSKNGSNRVNLGGSWNGYARFCRVSNRYYDSPSFRYDNIGFRLAR